MTCFFIKRRSTDYVDGRLRARERSRVAAHLENCLSCSLEVQQVASVRSALMELREPRAPAGLKTHLLVIASRESKTIAENRLERLWNRCKLRLDQILRPLTIPATGGLLSSLLLFATLAFSIGTSTRGVTYEVPVVYSDHTDANLVPLQLRSAIVLTLSLDGHGHITDYAVRDGSASFVGDPTRLQDNNISLPDFPNVLAMAHPITRDISISFTPIVFRQ
ncbi:MAG: zf-HC2 domain-containing protein [Bryobacteraceae bacterium]